MPEVWAFLLGYPPKCKLGSILYDQQSASLLIIWLGTFHIYLHHSDFTKGGLYQQKWVQSSPQIPFRHLWHQDCENDGCTREGICLQADAGAQAVQIFDSWASELQPQDFDVFAGPYIQKIIDSVRKTHPDLAIILYISGSGGLLERMADCKPDVVSVDQRVDMADAIRRIGPTFAVQVIVSLDCPMRGAHSCLLYVDGIVR